MKNGSHALPRHQGFSLIEAAIVLGIVGLVIGGLWTAATSVSEKLKMSRAITQTITFHQCVTSKWPRHVYTSAYAIANISDSRSITRMVNRAGCMQGFDVSGGAGSEIFRSPWGDEATVGFTDINGAAYPVYAFHGNWGETTLPVARCARYLNGVLTASVKSWYSTQIGGTVYYNPRFGSVFLLSDLSFANLYALCDANATGGNLFFLTVTFVN